MATGRVVAAMSGGVDSSVAAAILKEQGWDVIGVTMQIWPKDTAGDSGCCGLGAIEDARKMAAKLGIRHYVMDFRREFEETVIADFCRQYKQGLTPNPCIRCNKYIKFELLRRRAAELDAGFIATGHYARVLKADEGYQLLKGVDPAKDQSYFLYNLTQHQLAHLLLPVGGLTKPEVRRLAAERGLPSAASKESQDICFIPGGDYRPFLIERLILEPGDIVNSAGNVLGRHKGLPLYTVGQRQGLGLASDKRLYVLKMDSAANRLVVGPEEELFSGQLTSAELTWISGQAPQGNGITAKIRYRAEEAPSKIEVKDNTARVTFEKPQRAVAPGQAVVFYQGEVVLGGGTIIIDN